MTTTTKSFLAMTAADLMSRDVVVVPRKMSLRTAGQLLARAQISGAPVVDDFGRCIGVLSANDFVQRFVKEEDPEMPTYPGCSMCADWQVMDLERMPTDEVEAFMTHDPVTTSPSTGIEELARMMLNAHIHRVIIIDPQGRPIGVVSSTDILAAVSRIDRTAWSE